jgi:2-dehydropantoate 2-reductase
LTRYIIFGAGAVGGLIGAQLYRAGHDVTLIARGANLEALAGDGLRLRTVDGEDVVRVPAVGNIAELAIAPDDVVILAMKTQDCAAALDQLASVAPPGIAVACALNGIESERMALRLFDNVYGIHDYVFAVMLQPGEVESYNAPVRGIFDIGRYPAGSDERAETIAADLRNAGFDSVVQPDIMRWKRGKLIANTGNAIGAACQATDQLADILKGAREEAEACYRAARLDYALPAESQARAAKLEICQIGGKSFFGGSTAQSLARGTPTTEVDYLSGEIALLGRTHGVPTPINAALQRVVRELTGRHSPPGALSPEDLRARIDGSAASGDAIRIEQPAGEGR